jgi:hypothetical protein
VLVRCGCRIAPAPLSVVKFFKNKIDYRKTVTPHDFHTTTDSRERFRLALGTI